MKKYILTSDKFTGEVTFGFDAAGFLVHFDNQAEFTEQQHEWLLSDHRFPKTLAWLFALQKVVKGEITEVPEDLSFDVFWERYGRKINRKRCEPMWRKMSDVDKMAAIANIKPYEQYLERTGYRGKADPENYLKREYFATEWKKEK